jgi:hypothetical protein
MTVEHVEGLKDLEEFLDKLPDRIARSGVQRVLRRALAPLQRLWHDNTRVRKRARGNGPAGRFRVSIDISSRLIRSVARGVRASGTAPACVAYVGPNKMGYPEALTEEFGAASHNETPPNAPGRRAWEAGQRTPLDIVSAELWPEIQKTADRYAKRSAG